MKRWLIKHYVAIHEQNYESWPEWLPVDFTYEPWGVQAQDAARKIVRGIKFPTKKPAAFLTIDDRAVCFKGEWPDPEKLLEFKPWNKRSQPKEKP